MFKKFFSIAFSLVLILQAFVPISVQANDYVDNGDVTDFEDVIVVTDEVVTEIALEWATAIRPDLELQVTNITPLHELDGSKAGYVASYFSMSGIPFGYIVLNFLSENIIDEFLIEEGMTGMVEGILDISNISRRMANNSIRVYRTLPFEYAVAIQPDILTRNSTRSLYGFNGEISQDEFSDILEHFYEINNVSPFSRSKVGHWGDVIINGIPSNFVVQERRNLNTATPISQNTATSTAGRYACGIQALMNIANTHNMYINRNFRETYIFLWNHSSTTTTNPGQTPMFGSTAVSNLGPALQALGPRGNVGRTVTFTRSTSPNFTTFRNAVIAGNSSIFTASVNLHSGSTSGHAVSVTGFVTARNRSATINYIRVADGWGTSHRFINWANSSLFSRNSIVFVIR